jgi:hypothetical protein
MKMERPIILLFPHALQPLKHTGRGITAYKHIPSYGSWTSHVSLTEWVFHRFVTSVLLNFFDKFGPTAWFMTWWMGYVSLITSGESVGCVTKGSWSWVGSTLNWQNRNKREPRCLETNLQQLKYKTATTKIRGVTINEVGLFADLLPDTSNIRRVYVIYCRISVIL